jgi:hypothetical protein
MKERGIVVSVKDNHAFVNVKRITDYGVGCCRPYVIDDEKIEALNSCKAQINDTVFVETEGNRITKREVMRDIVCGIGFFAGIAASYVGTRLLHIETGSEFIACGIGALGAVIAFFIFKAATKGKTVLPVIYEVIPSESKV